MEYLFAIAALFLLAKSGALGSIGSNIGGVSAPPTATPVVASPINTGLQNVGGVAQSGLQFAQTALAKAGSSLASAVPVIGAALGAVLSVFAAASAKRAAEAKSENQAVGNAVPAWDQNVAVIVANYNNGSWTAGQVAQALDAIWQNYWTEVGPQIQPGRNGCQSGTVTQPKGVSFCGGTSYGAACCVGYDDLKNSNDNMKYAVGVADNTGKPTPASILPVFASKYGGINRPGYTVTFIRPS